jgi:HD domain
MEPITQKLIHTFESLADLGEEVANSGDYEEMIRTSLHLLLGTLAIRRGVVLECESDSNTLEGRAIWGMSVDFQPPASMTEAGKETLLGTLVGLALNDENCEQVFTDGSAELVRQGIQVVVPMFVRGDLTGLVLLGGKASGEPFTAADFDIIRAMVRHIGVGVHTHRLLVQLEQRAEENRRIYEELRTIYRDTIKAFAAAIDIKDKYTQGHSERVGKYSEIIAREMGWNEEAVEGIAIAGYLHDVGKLVVERDIINAPYRIDAKASNELNLHPTAGYEILSPIHHPYADIPLMARHHHERIDGRGYPDGLAGDEIPLGARIVSVADSFDAMTTDRPYRTRRSFPDVIEDLRCNAGKQFDSQVVAAFCRALLKELQGETKERGIMRLLGKNYLDSEQAVSLLSDLISELEEKPPAVAASV